MIVAIACNSPVRSDDPEPPEGEQGIAINGPGGWLKGMARASYSTLGSAIIALPDISVFARNALTLVDSPIVKTDFFGDFAIPLANAKYKICWSRPGFTSTCTSTIYTVNNNSVWVGFLNVVPSTTRRLRGLTQLSDTTSCLTSDGFFGVQIAAKAEMLNSSGVSEVSVVPNRRGEFVLPWSATSAQVKVTCGTAVAQLSIANADSTGATQFSIVINNKRPHIRSISATAAGQDPFQGVSPGTTVQLGVVAVDPDGNPLTYKWRAPSGTLVDTGTPSAQWTVPTSNGTYEAYVAVNDGKGGYATRSVGVRVRSSPTVRFTGSVRDTAGNVIIGATASVGSTSTTTDGAGKFAVTVAESANYLLNISKAGYAEFSQRVRVPSRGRRFVLTQAFAVPINPAVQNIVQDGRQSWLNPCLPKASCPRIPGKVTIPPNSLDLNPPPVGGLTAYIATYDPSGEALPGDQSAINPAGTEVALVSTGALFIEVRDSAGTKYNLAAGKTATVDIPIQSAFLPESAPTIEAWKYIPATGKWAVRASGGTKNGNFYSITVPNFSTQNADIEKTNPACLYIDLEGGLLADFTLNARLQVSPPGGAPRSYEVSLDVARNTFYNLPTNAPYTIEVRDASGVTPVTKLSDTGSTGAPWGGVGDPGTSQPNCTIYFVEYSDINTTEGAYTKFLEKKSVGSLARANGYYAGIDPSSLRTTLGAFWMQNGWDPVTGAAADEARTAFINYNDLGFGRDMHCRQNVSNMACYVTNYGAADQSPGNYDLAKAADKTTAGATVAMEYSPIEGQDGVRVVKFYAYGGGLPTSGRIPSADLDGAGQKFIPNLCLNCHGGDYNPANDAMPLYPGDLNAGASFREFDIYSYRDGTLGDKPNSLASGTTEIVDLVLGQQSAFLAQNLLVRDHSAPASPIAELISKFYPGDAIPFDANAIPDGWTAAVTGNVSTEGLYHNVVAKACRTCHVAVGQPEPWNTYDQFKTYRLNGFIPFAVCYFDAADVNAKKARYMPHTNVTFKNFWLSTGPTTLGIYTGPGWASTINSEPGAECIP